MSERLGAAVLDLSTNNAPLIAGIEAAKQKSIKGMLEAGRQSKVAMAGAMAAVGVAVGVGLYKVGAAFDDAFDNIQSKTGATGKKLASLKDDFRAVAKDVPADFGEISDAIAEVNQRLGLTGKPLQERAKQFLELSRITKTDLGTNIQAVTRLFGDWGVKTGDQANTMDKLYRMSTKTGISVSELATQMTNFGSPLRQLGIDFDHAAAMFAEFEQNGVNTRTLMPGLRFAIKAFSGATPKLTSELKAMGVSMKDPQKALAQVMTLIKKAPSDLAANSIAFKVFGTRAGPDMAAAIREGHFELDNVIKAMNNGKATIVGTADDTNDLTEKFQILKNRGMLVLEPAAASVFGAMSQLASVILDVTSFMNRAQIPIGPLVAALVGGVGLFMAITKVKAIFLAMKAAMLANPYVAVAAATIVIATLIITHWSTVKRALLAAWDAIKGAATSTFNFLKYLFLNFTPEGQILQHWRNIRDVLLGIWDKISGSAKTFASAVKSAVVNAFVGVVNTVIGFVNKIIDVLDKIPGVNIGKIDKIQGPVKVDKNSGANAEPRFATGGIVKSPRYVVGEEAPAHPEVVIATNPAYRKRNLGLFHAAGRMLGIPGFAQGGFVSSAYGPPWGGIQGGGTTATGVDLHSNPHILGVAVDPSVIKLGSKLKITPNPFGTSQPFTAFDTGGAIKGNRIDFYDWLGRAHQYAWGMRNVTVSSVKGGGGLLGSIGHFLGGLPGAASGVLGKGADWLISKLPGLGNLPDWLKATGKWAIGKATGWIKNKVGGLLGLGGGGGSVGKGVAGSIKDAISFASGFGFGMPSLGQLTGGQHANGSYHYLGRAADFGHAGHPESQMRRLFSAFLGKYGSNIKELFYDPIGFYIKNGAKVPGAIGGHMDHIHLALARGGLMNGRAGGMGGLPFVGSFGGGGVVPLPAGHPGLAIVHGQEEIGLGGRNLVNVEHMEVRDSGDAQIVARSLAWSLST